MSFWTFTIKDLIEVCILFGTMLIIWHGPRQALKLTRGDQEAREKQRRKYHVFHELMRTRGIVLSPAHVLALNLIQLEFYGNAAVEAAYSNYMGQLNTPYPTTDDAAALAHGQRRQDLLFDLLHAIGADLGMSFDKRELERLSYSPQGWANEEQAIKTLRDYAIQVITGKRAVHVAPFGGPDPRYPAPPAPTEPAKLETKA